MVNHNRPSPPSSTVLVLVLLVVAVSAGAQSGEVLSLERAISLALDTSQALERSQLEIEAARSGLDKANSAFGPSVSGSAGVAYLADPPESVSIPAGAFGAAPDPVSMEITPIPAEPVVLVPDVENLAYSLSVSLQQTIFTWGKLTAGREAAQAEIEATLSRRGQSERDIRRSASLAFAGVYYGRSSLDLLRQTEELLTARVADARERFETGVVTRGAVLTEEASLAGLRTQIVRTAQSVRSAEASLAWFTGVAEIGELSPIGFPESIPPEDDLVGRAVSYDPSLSELRSRTTQALVQATLARASRPLLPDIGLTVTAEVQGQTLPFVESDWDDSWDADLTISIGASANLFDSGANAADRAAAEAQYGQALSAVAEYESALPLQVRSAVEAYLIADARIAESAIRLDGAVEQARVATVSFENDLITRADALSARAAVLEAELSAIAAELAKAQAYFELIFLSGLE